jgi:hypothetical protein
MYVTYVFARLDISTVIQKHFAAINMTILASNLQSGSQRLLLRVQ